MLVFFFICFTGCFGFAVTAVTAVAVAVAVVVAVYFAADVNVDVTAAVAAGRNPAVHSARACRATDRWTVVLGGREKKRNRGEKNKEKNCPETPGLPCHLAYIRSVRYIRAFPTWCVCFVFQVESVISAQRRQYTLCP